MPEDLYISLEAILPLMVLAGWRIWRSTRVAHQNMVERERDRLLCDYCGGQNADGDLRCRFCGAPLR